MLGLAPRLYPSGTWFVARDVTRVSLNDTGADFFELSVFDELIHSYKHMPDADRRVPCLSRSRKRSTGAPFAFLCPVQWLRGRRSAPKRPASWSRLKVSS